MPPPPPWQAILRRIGAEMGSFALEAWLHPLAVEPDGEGLRLLCPTPFHRERIRARWLDRIRECAAEEAGRPVAIALGVGAGAPVRDAEPEPSAAPAPRVRPAAVPAARAPAAAPRQAELPYRFENFVVGPCNALAREACVALAEGRQLGLDVLVISADQGLGKTHLARAIDAAARRLPDRRVVCVSAERFTNEFQASLVGRSTARFKRRFRDGCDVLVVDDVQFVAGKRATQLELFHTIEHVVDAGGRVVLTSDRLPREIENLEPRLRSRMLGGLVAEIEPPDAQVRRAILKAKAAAGGVRLPEDCLDLLVDQVRGNVRDLDGALVQVVASSALLKRPIDLTLARAALRKHAADPEPPRGRPLRVEDVVRVVARAFETTPAALASRSRRRDVLLPRQLAMYLARRYTPASLQEIGRAVGREHPAVSNAIGVVEKAILERAPLRYQVEALAARLEDLSAGRGAAPGA